MASLATGSALFALLGSTPPTELVPERAFCVPSRAHWLGCGDAGVDVLAVASHAELRGLALAGIVALIGWTIGTPLGALCAYRGGWPDRVLSRTCDLLQAFPTFLLAITTLAAVQRPSRVHVGIVFAFLAWIPFARLALTEARVLRTMLYVDAARALGASTPAIILRHFIPALSRTTAVQLGSSAAALVVSEAALAFVGFGPRDGVSLGSLIEQGVFSMLRAPHVLVLSATLLFVTNASLLIAGRALGAGRSEGFPGTF